MIIQSLQKLFKRDLKKLRKEVESYEHERNLWRVEKSISNSAGNLCLHLVGNLKAYIGVGLADIEYTRDREYEFSAKNIPREKLLKEIDESVEIVDRGLGKLEEHQLHTDFPIIVLGEPTEMEFTLMHLSTHINYHLGEINYHRRLLDES